MTKPFRGGAAAMAVRCTPPCRADVLPFERHAALANTDALEAALRDHVVATSAASEPFVWTDSVDAILASVARRCRRTSGAVD